MRWLRGVGTDTLNEGKAFTVRLDKCNFSPLTKKGKN
jgi:hypothetical protein